MTYSVYLGKTLAINNLSKEEAEKKVEEFRKMIFVGVRSDYSPDDIKIKEE